jgi:hypothetical protein
MKFVDSLNIRGKILVPTIALVAIALTIAGVLVWVLNETSTKYRELIHGPVLAAKVSGDYAGQLSELGRIVNLALLQADGDLQKLRHDFDELKTARKQSREQLERLFPDKPEVQGLKATGALINDTPATISQIEGSVGHLRTIAHSNSSAAEQITATMVQLSKLSNETRQRLLAFKTE